MQWGGAVISKKNDKVDVFLDYSKLEKMTNSLNWYESVVPFVPSTINGIESGKGQIKDSETFRARCPIGVL